MTRLKLGPLADDRPVKLTVELTTSASVPVAPASPQQRGFLIGPEVHKQLRIVPEL